MFYLQQLAFQHQVHPKRLSDRLLRLTRLLHLQGSLLPPSPTCLASSFPYSAFAMEVKENGVFQIQ